MRLVMNLAHLAVEERESFLLLRCQADQDRLWLNFGLTFPQALWRRAEVLGGHQR